MKVGIFSLASFGELQLSGDGGLDISKSVEVISSVGVIGAEER